MILRRVIAKVQHHEEDDKIDTTTTTYTTTSRINHLPQQQQQERSKREQQVVSSSSSRSFKLIVIIALIWGLLWGFIFLISAPAIFQWTMNRRTQQEEETNIISSSSVLALLLLRPQSNDQKRLLLRHDDDKSNNKKEEVQQQQQKQQQQQQLEETTPLQQQPPVTSTASSKSSCALLFFGVPRLFDIVYPSIQKFVLQPNLHCDVYVHTYNITTLNTTRNNEINGHLSPQDVYKLVAPHHDNNTHNHVTIESMDNFYALYNLTHYRQYHHYGWGNCCDSIDNMIKQWHSIQSVWNLMEERQQSSAMAYDRIGLFRSDVFYTHPISITNDPQEAAVVPNWDWEKKKIRDIVNDRMFYGSYQNAKIWSTKRFDYLNKYVVKAASLQQDPNYTNNGMKNYFLKGIHSETFLYHLLVTEYNMTVRYKPICFWLARTNGNVLSFDCNPPPYYDTSTTTTTGGDNNASIWERLLENVKCYWKKEYCYYPAAATKAATKGGARGDNASPVYANPEIWKLLQNAKCYWKKEYWLPPKPCTPEEEARQALSTTTTSPS